MITGDIEQYLLACLGSEDATIKSAAVLTHQYTAQFRSGQISKEEYTEILADIDRSAVISNHMSDMEAKEMLHTALHGLIAVASAL